MKNYLWKKSLKFILECQELPDKSLKKVPEKKMVNSTISWKKEDHLLLQIPLTQLIDHIDLTLVCFNSKYLNLHQNYQKRI